MMHRFAALLAAVTLTLGTWADEWYDSTTGYTWTYTVTDGEAEIRNGSWCAVSPKPSGALAIPSTLNGYPVTSIGYSAFRGCSGLTSVTIPEGVTSIESYAFEYCSRLTSVTIPEGVTSIESYAFEYCSRLTSVTIPEGVTSIGDSAFSGCSGLTSVTIPSSVTSIGSYAFRGCSGLTSVTIPEGVTSIGDRAFSGCSRLTSVTIPEGVTSIGSSAFRGCSGLTSVTIPEGVTSIGDSAFSGCSGLTSVTIPSVYRLSSVFPDAYRRISSVVIPEGVTSIGWYAFESCSGLTSVTIPEGVTSIGSSAFRGCSGLTSVTIPEGVTSIGDEAFRGCSGLTSVTIPSSVTSIGECAFHGCSGLTSVTIPSVCRLLSVFPDAYRRISSVVIPEGVTSIGWYAFGGCSGLTSVTIPSSVTSIGSSAFSGCSGLTSVTIPSSVTSIGSSAFSACSGLTSVTIPASVTSIGDNAFRGCSGLTSLVVPSGVSSVGVSAFEDCGECVFRFRGGCPRGRDVFGGSPAGTICHINAGAGGWPDDGGWCGATCLPTVTVEITPAGKTVFRDSVSVSIDCTEGAEIHYTADGTRPTAASPVYRRPFTVNRKATVKAIAFAADGDSSPIATAQLGTGWTGAPTISSEQGDTFYLWNNRVTLACATPSARILYTTDGSDPLEGGVLYEGPFPISESTVVRAVAVHDEYVDSEVVERTFTRERHTVATPEILTGRTAPLTESVNVVQITCATDGATVYYSTGGDFAVYTGPFRIPGATTVRAYAIKDDWTRSETATRAIAKTWTDGTVVGMPGRVFLSTTSSIWTEDDSVAYEGGSSMRSGRIGNGGTSDLQTTVVGRGTIAFHWRASCEDDPFMDNMDYVRFLVDGVERARLDGVTGWEAFSCEISTPGTHVLAWEYVKDDRDFDGEDCAWVDGVAFTPEAVVHVRFNGNEATGGELPEAIPHCLGERVELPDSGTLVRDRYDFVGWSDGARVYGPGSLYEPPDTDVTLSAVWEPRITASPRIVVASPFEAVSTPVTIEVPAGTEVHYTLDGGDPTADSARYTSPFHVSGDSTTIRAVAVRAGWFDSPVVSVTAVCAWRHETVEGATWFFSDGVVRACTNAFGRVLVPATLGGSPVVEVGEHALSGRHYDNDVEALVVPEGIVRVQMDAFECLERLQTLVLPSTLVYVGDCAFSECDVLANVYWCMREMPSTRSAIFAESSRDLVSHIPWEGPSTHTWCERAWASWTPPSNGASGMIASVLGDRTVRTVSFDANGGVCGETGRRVMNGNALGELPSATRAGYSFTGWFTAAAGGSAVAANTRVTADLTLFARWEAIRYEIAYTLGGGVNAAGNPSSYTVEDAVRLAAPSRTGFRFTGWTPDGGVIPLGSTGNRAFIALWEVGSDASSFTVSFDANGGEVSEGSRAVVGDSACGELPVPVRVGYGFDGWFTAPNGGSPVSETTPISASTTLYAHWTPVDYPIVYHLGGGRNTAANPTTYTVETELLLETPEKEGFLFEGWTPNGGRIIRGTTGPLEFTAGWRMAPGVVCVTVTFDANGGTIYEPSRSVVEGGEVGELPTPVCANRVFVGWYTAATGGSPVTAVTRIPSAVTYYAHWQSANYNIVYVLNGGVNAASNPATYSADAGVVLAPPTRPGYAFAGWTPNGGVIAAGSTGDVTMTASWTPNSVRIELPDGTVVDTKVGASITLPTADARPGRVLVGWTDGKTTYAPGDRYTVPAEGVHLEAVYESAILYPGEGDGLGGEVSAPYEAAAVVYDGYLYEGEALAGTVQVKVAKMARGAAKVTATVQLGAQKLSFKGGVADAAGNVTDMTVKGHTLALTLGQNGLSGQLDGVYAIDGARSLFTSKDRTEKAAADALVKKVQGAVNVILPDGRGVLTVTIVAKGKVKVAGTVSGVKVSATSQLLIGEDAYAIPVVITKKADLAFVLWLDEKGALSVDGLDGAVVGKAGTLKAGAALSLDATALAKTLSGLYTDYLPDGLSVSQSRTKWVVAGGAKAGKVVLDRKTGEIDETKLGANPSGLKLTYTAKTGAFKGSFKAYALEKGKIKAYTVNIAGVMVGSTGYGTATLKKPAVSCPVTIE